MDKSLFATLENRSGYQQTNEQNILNPYVKFNRYEGSQALHDTLVAESIQMRGLEFYYLEREYTNLANALKGTLLKIGPNSDTYINIFDIRRESIENGEKGFLASKIIKFYV